MLFRDGENREPQRQSEFDADDTDTEATPKFMMEGGKAELRLEGSIRSVLPRIFSVSCNNRGAARGPTTAKTAYSLDVGKQHIGRSEERSERHIRCLNQPIGEPPRHLSTARIGATSRSKSL